MLTKTTIAVATLLSGGCLSLGGSYAYSRTSIGDDVIGYCLPSDLEAEENGVWKIAQDALKGASENLSTEFNALKTKVTSSSDSTKGTEMKNGCSEIYKYIYKTIFSEDKRLLNDAKKYCFVDIKTKLTDSKIFKNESESDSDKATIESKIQSLSSHNDEQHGKMDEDLKTRSKGDQDAKNKWKEHRSWCQSLYKKPFQGEKDNTWKLANSYCSK